MLSEPTLEKLNAMRLFGMAGAWREQQGQAGMRKLDFDERFGLLVDAEALYRESQRRDRRLKEAKLRHSNACLEDFDEPAKRGLERSLLQRLASCTWVDEHRHVVITGPTGVGKTYLACALGNQACRRGYRVLYRRTPRLVDELALARADGSLPRLLQRLARTDLLVLDDWGLARLRDQDRRDLLEVLEDRDGLRATVLTSQIPVAKWHDYLADPNIADAIADRLLPASYQIMLKGHSRRTRKKEASTKS
jgi:DNA replication protein DnaC